MKEVLGSVAMTAIVVAIMCSGIAMLREWHKAYHHRPATTVFQVTLFVVAMAVLWIAIVTA